MRYSSELKQRIKVSLHVLAEKDFLAFMDSSSSTEHTVDGVDGKQERSDQPDSFSMSALVG